MLTSQVFFRVVCDVSGCLACSAGGKAAAVAGYAGPGFHIWPPGHIPQDYGSESAFTQPVTCSKDVRRRDRGQRTGGNVVFYSGNKGLCVS